MRYAATADDLIGAQGFGRCPDGRKHLEQRAPHDDEQHYHRNPEVHSPCLVVAHVAEPGRGYVGLQHDAEQENVETPTEDSRQHGYRELVLPGASREPGADRAVADQPDDENAQPVQQCQHGEMHQRTQSLLGDGAAGEAVTKLVQDPAQHGFGANGHKSDET